MQDQLNQLTVDLVAINIYESVEDIFLRCNTLSKDKMKLRKICLKNVLKFDLPNLFSHRKLKIEIKKIGV